MGGVLGKALSKTKYVTAGLLICLVVANKSFGWGLDETEWTLILSISGGALGLDSLEGMAASLGKKGK